MATDVDRRSRVRGALLGLAAGDALGTTLEFTAPGTFEPVHEIVGGGPFGLPAGGFTDDTSMALCLAESLVATGRFDLLDQLDRYVRWWREGHLSATGRCFDIGGTTRGALHAYEERRRPQPRTDAGSAGNGSLMRVAPAALAGATVEDAIDLAGRSSRATHGAPAAVDACRYLGAQLHAAAAGASRDEVLDPGFWRWGPLRPEIEEIARGSFRRREPPAIRGTGHVVRSLEAALWALAGADGFADGARRAVNLGEDADTTGAVYGQLAGALSGEDGIPARWRDVLVMRETIERLADGVAALALAAPAPVPWDETYWALPGVLLAGEYPGGKDRSAALPRLEALIDAGVRVVLDLTEEGELVPYADDLRAVALSRGVDVTWRRHPIRDLSVPGRDGMRRILDAIADAEAEGTPAYVHCWGGVGRTGTVVGCALVERGRTPAEALAEIGRLRAWVGKARLDSPETAGQVAFVEAWLSKGDRHLVITMPVVLRLPMSAGAGYHQVPVPF